MAGFETLPTELRYWIYPLTVRGRVLFCTRPFLFFRSRSTQDEYRGVLEGKERVKFHVADFNFVAATKYLRDCEREGTIDRHLQNGFSAVVHIRFTKKFNGTQEGFDKWTRFLTQLAKRHQNRKLDTTYFVLRRDTDDIPAMEGFKSNLFRDPNLPPDSEWAKLLDDLMPALAPVARFRRAPQAEQLYHEGLYAARQRTAITQHAANNGIGINEVDQADLVPVNMPADEMSKFDNDNDLKHLMGDNYYKLIDGEVE